MSRRISVRRHISSELRSSNTGGSSSSSKTSSNDLNLPQPQGGAMKPVHPSASFRVRTRPSPRKLNVVDSFGTASHSTMQPLGVDTLRPLVDLAYWSTFVEVRRDCAAAFATLSMNDTNLEVLSQAGALGALLALVGVGNHKNDSQVHRDAATALSQLVKLDDIKLRLLKAPDGLKALFYMTRSPSVSVKRAAIKTLYNLATIDNAKAAIFGGGGAGAKTLLSLVTVKDEKSKRFAVKVLRRCAELETNRNVLMNPAALGTIISLIMETPDSIMRKDMIEIINLLGAVGSENKEILMEMGILPALLRHADLTLSTVQMSLQCVECLSLLVSNQSRNQLYIVDKGAIGVLVRCVFEDLPRFFSRGTHRGGGGSGGYNNKHGGNNNTNSSSLTSATLNVRTDRHSMQRAKQTKSTKKNRPLKKSPHHHHHHHHHHATSSSSSSSSSPQTSVSPQLQLTRSCMSIFKDVAGQRKARDTLIEWGLLDYLLQESVAFAMDRRTRRVASKIIMLLSENDGEGTVRHQDMVAKGVLPVLIQFLKGEDYDLRMDAAATLAHMSVSDELKGPICQAHVLPVLLPLIELQDDVVAMSVTRVLAEVADVVSNESLIIAGGGLEVLVKMISPTFAHFKAARLEAVRALSSLSSSENVRSKMIGNNALGYLISISKTGKGMITCGFNFVVALLCFLLSISLSIALF
jgi:hypothetical protein